MNPMSAFRIGLPLLMVLAGVALIVLRGENGDGAGVLIAGSGVLVALAGGMLRFSMRESEERDAEQAAREHYRQHGRWPDE
jgi:drug/metabolite transporter (DMT)-like permease